MGWRERAVVTALVWLGVYPAVLGMNYLLGAVGLDDMALPLKVFITTAFTVPIIEFLVVPRVKGVIERAERKIGIEGGLRED